MSINALLATAAVADRTGKSPFYFSRFKFTQMKERGNTHYCFYCGGQFGFTPDKDGNATNCDDPDGYNTMTRHDPVAHATGIIGEADKYDDVESWLRGVTYPKDFAFVINVSSIF